MNRLNHKEQKRTSNGPSQVKMRQVGMVLRGYRQAAGLSQDGLRDVLVDDSRYTGPRDRSTLSNYERGQTMPGEGFLREFLAILGPVLEEKGVKIDAMDLDHLLYIAGYSSQVETDVSDLRSNVKVVRDGQERLREGVEGLSERVSSSLSIEERLKDAAVKMIPPALYVATVGYLIDALGLVRSWVIMAYVVVGFGIVVGTPLLRRLGTGRQDRVGDLFFVSAFLLMSSPLLQGAFTRMDHYGFHTLSELTGRAVPFMLAMVVNLVLSLVATAIFNVLRNWLAGENRSLRPIVRALAATVPPVIFLYTNVLLFCNPGMWLYFSTTFATMGAGFVALLAFRDPYLRLDVHDTWMVKATFALILTVAVFWAWGTFASYVQPSGVASGDHNLLVFSDGNSAGFETVTPDYAERLGYPVSEYVSRTQFGMIWMSVATGLYLVVVLGSAVLSAIRSRLREV